MKPNTESLAFLCEARGVRIACTYGANKKPGWSDAAHGYSVTLRYKRRSLTCDFFQGAAHTKEPTAADVLSCLISDASAEGNAFESWCGEFGYDTDSRKAFDTYTACVRLGKAVKRLLGEDFETFAKAEH